MALKNLFDMVKADRYTQDGREAIIKAQEAETEDATRRTYQIGEISQKTGLQKTANGWVKPKSKAAPAKKQEKKGAGIPQATTETFVGKTYKDFVESATPSGYKPTKNTDNPDGSSTTVFEKEGKQLKVDFDKTGKITKVTPGESKPAAGSKPETKLPAKPTRGMSESYIRGTQLMKPAEDESQRGEQHWAGVLSGYDNTSVIEQRKQLQEIYDEFEDDIKDYDRRGLAPAVYAKRINQQNFIKGALKAIDDEMESRGLDPAPNFSRPRDAAPRVLTGDTRIRVRKA